MFGVIAECALGERSMAVKWNGLEWEMECAVGVLWRHMCFAIAATVTTYFA